jgi:hypothetical protein
MMNVSQQRDAEAAANRRLQEHDAMVAEQMDKERQAKQAAAEKADRDRRYEQWLRMSGHADMTSPGGDAAEPMPSGMAIPGVE